MGKILVMAMGFVDHLGQGHLGGLGCVAAYNIVTRNCYEIYEST